MKENPFHDFDEHIERLALLRRPHIAFGLREPDREILESLERSKKYAEITLVGPKAIQDISQFKVIVDTSPEEKIAQMLAGDEIEGIVRGTIDDFKTRETYQKITGESFTLEPALVEDIAGHRFFLAPASNPEGWEKEQRLLTAKGLAEFTVKWKIPAKVAIYAGTRHETYKRKKEITEGIVGMLNKTYEDAEWIVEKLKKENIDAKNWSIDFDLAIRDGYTIHIPVNGMVGNQMFRVLLSCGGKMLLASLVGFSRPWEDNSRNEKDFDFHIKWLAALINEKNN
jgi:predicted methyltransferase MtxX (methanogen marker protein 4)